MGITTKGLDELIRKERRFPAALAKEQRATLQKHGRDMQRDARQNHRYNNPPHMMSAGRQYSPSGNLDRSISYAVRKVNKLDALTLRVFLDPTYTTNGGVDYGKIQHDGMGSGFKLSPASPRRGTTGRNNLEHDWFLYNAFMRGVPRLKAELSRAPERAARKVGLA